MKKQTTRESGAGRGAPAPRRGRSGSTSGAGSQSQNRNVRVEVCGTCENDIGEDAIGCDECELWFHNTDMCTGLTQDMLDAISRYNGRGIKFVCMKCRLDSCRDKNNSHSGKSDSHVVEMVGQLYQQLRGMCSVVQALADQVKTLTAEIKDRAPSSEPATLPQNHHNRSQPAGTYASVTASHLPQGGSSPDDYRKVVRQELRELEEQRKRKTSLIIRGLGASSASEAVEKF